MSQAAAESKTSNAHQQLVSEPPHVAQFLQKLLARATQIPESQLLMQQLGCVEQTFDTQGWQVAFSASPGSHGLCTHLFPPPDELLLTALVMAELDTELFDACELDVPPVPPAPPLAGVPPAPPVAAAPPVLLAPPLPP